MTPVISNYMKAPFTVPNGLHATDKGLWIVDQLTDRMALVALEEPHEYGVSRILHEIPTESSTTSGVSYGEGALWLGANGAGDIWRYPRKTDALSGTGEIFKVNPQTGETLARYPLPGDGGTHGLAYDHVETGAIWLSTLHDKTLTEVHTSDWSIKKVIPLPYDGGHGMVRSEDDALWMVFKQSRIIAKLSIRDGAVLDEIQIGPEHPEPHGLTRVGNDLLYCDAMTAWIVRIKGVFE